MKKFHIIVIAILILLSGVHLATAQTEPDKIILDDAALLELYRMSSTLSREPAYRLYMDLYADKLSIPDMAPADFEALLERLREEAWKTRHQRQ